MDISQEFLTKNILFNRYIDETLQLPYSYNEIKIQPNDTVSCELLNLKFKHLYDNFIYLYRSSLIASNIIPVSSTAIAGITANSTEFTWYKNLSTSQFISISSNPSYTGLDNANLCYLVNNRETYQYTALISNNNYFKGFLFDSDANYFTESFTISEIDPEKGSLYSCITAFALYNNYLYVVDCDLCKVVKYDASGLTTNTVINSNKLTFLNSVGNKGNAQSKLEFNNPTGITVYNNFVYVLDSGNKCVKKFDSDLNWLATYRLSIDLKDTFPLDIGSDYNGKIYIITRDNTLLIYDNDFNSKSVYNLNKIKENNEIFSKIVFSKQDNNIFYIVTNKNIYKKLTTSPDSTIGKYLLYLYNYNIPSEIISSFSSAYADNGDKNIIFSYANNTGKLGLFLDNLNLYDVLAVRDFDIYTFEDMQFNNDEYLQNWVINKNISKLLVNLMRFRDQIIGKFIASQDYKTNVVFKGTRYLLPQELESIFFEQDITFYIGANELVTNNIVNRALYKLFNIQNSILNILQSQVENILREDIPIILN